MKDRNEFRLQDRESGKYFYCFWDFHLGWYVVFVDGHDEAKVWSSIDEMETFLKGDFSKQHNPKDLVDLDIIETTIRTCNLGNKFWHQIL